MEKLFGIALLILYSAAVQANGPCPADELCPQFIRSIATCQGHPSSKICSEFISTFRKLTPRYDCRRSFDTAPVPAVWLCEDSSTPGPHERAVALASKLKFKAGRAFFGSEALRSTLDGEVAEEYLEKSKEVGKRRKSR